jgi:hypothetical protein
VTTPKGTQALEGCVMSFAYWNPAIRTQAKLLNAQSGKLEAVQVSRAGSGTVEVRGQPVAGHALAHCDRRAAHRRLVFGAGRMAGARFDREREPKAQLPAQVTGLCIVFLLAWLFQGPAPKALPGDSPGQAAFSCRAYKAKTCKTAMPKGKR